MAEKFLPSPDVTSSMPSKDVLILAGGLVGEKDYQKQVKKTVEKKAKEGMDINKSTHTDLMNLMIQSYENRDLPSTYMDDAFRLIVGQGDLHHMPQYFPIKLEQINDLIYEMLKATQENIPQGLTAEDISNIGEGSIQNFYAILRSVGATKDRYEDIVEDVKVFGKQFARTLEEKRKTHKAE